MWYVAGACSFSRLHSISLHEYTTFVSAFFFFFLISATIEGHVCSSIWLFQIVLLGIYLYLTRSTEVWTLLFSIYSGVGLLGYRAGLTANLP